MPRRGQRLKVRKPAPVKPNAPQANQPDPLAHNALVRYLNAHFEHLLARGYSRDTVRARKQSIRRFISWADERGITDPNAVTRPILEQYQRYLYYYRKQDGRPLSLGMQGQYLAPLKTWFAWLVREHHIAANPASDLELPKLPKALPKSILSVQEVEAILNEAEPTTIQGLRDRALLETLYATGLRRTETAAVGLYDIDLNKGVLWVKQGKGNRQRVVPLGERASAWLEKYINDSRPGLATALNPNDALFLSDYGEPMQPHAIADKVKRYMEFAGINKPGSTHLLRHACATHLLDGGADIRYIQEMLGHANLETTEIYTHVSIERLIAVHHACHPAKLNRKPGTDDGQ